MLPDCTVHGVWVRSLVHDMFGRICYRLINHPSGFDFLVMWEPDPDLGTKRHHAGYATAESLMVRPYKPKPWHKMPVKEIVYEGEGVSRAS